MQVFADIADVFLPSPLLRLWQSRAVAQTAWLRAGGCTRCDGVGWLHGFCDHSEEARRAELSPLLMAQDVRAYNETKFRDLGPVSGGVIPQTLFRGEMVIDRDRDFSRGDFFSDVAAIFTPSPLRDLWQARAVAHDAWLEAGGCSCSGLDTDCDSAAELDPLLAHMLPGFFTTNTLGSGIKWDAVDPEINIAFQVSYVAATTFSMTLFGKSVL